MNEILERRLDMLNSIKSSDPAIIRYLQHLNKHRKLVLEICTKLGIPEIGKLHDIDKYEPSRLEIYAAHWQDKLTSDELEYKKHKLAHRMTNKHHPQYWYNKPEVMDFDSFLEMIADWIASGIVNDEKYEPANTRRYYYKNTPELLSPIPSIKSAAEEWLKYYSNYGLKYLDRDKIKKFYDRYNKGLICPGDKGGKIIL